MNFFERYKKIFAVLAFLAIVFIMGYFLYITFFKTTILSPVEPVATSTSGLPQSEGGTGGQVVTPGQPGTIGGLGNAGQPNSPTTQTPQSTPGISNIATVATPVTDTPAFNMQRNGNGFQYYNPNDGKFYTVDAQGNKNAMSDQVFYNVKKVDWSPTKDRAVIEYPDNSKIIYDFKNNKQYTLPKHWQDFSFSPAGDNLVLKSMGNDPDNRWLAVSSNDGSGVKPIEQIGDASTVYPSWSPNQQTVAMYTDSQGLDRQKVYFVGLHGENFKAATIEGRDFRYQWAPQGDRMLYSVYSAESNLKPALYIVNAQGDQIGTNRQPLKVETWADKCTFADNTTVYCAVPEKLNEGAGMFPKMAENTADSIYRINTATGFKEQVAVPSEAHTISEITTSEDGNTLFFNDQSGKAYKIDLK